jgi:hypothetical protein
MWVLTKMAMLFFIASLAGVLLIFGGYQQTGLCNEEARAISDRVSSGLSQVINSPVEDERRIIQLEPALSVGDGKSARYTLNITRRITDRPEFNTLLISAYSDANRGCNSGVQVTYNKRWDDANDKRLFFMPATSSPPRYYRGAFETMALRPSVLNPAVQGPRSTFVALVKCTQKNVGRKVYVFIQDCTQQDAKLCIGFSSNKQGENAPGSIESLCGFEVTPTP